MSLDIWFTEGNREVFSSNITHNCNTMADLAGIYGAVWRPEENDIKTAAEVGSYVRRGLIRMLNEPEPFRKVEASNGWGTYDQFIDWLIGLLRACEQYPDATVEVSR